MYIFLFYSVLIVVPISSRLQYRDQVISHLPVLLTPKTRFCVRSILLGSICSCLATVLWTYRKHSNVGMSSWFKVINDDQNIFRRASKVEAGGDEK